MSSKFKAHHFSLNWTIGKLTFFEHATIGIDNDCPLALVLLIHPLEEDEPYTKTAGAVYDEPKRFTWIKGDKRI